MIKKAYIQPEVKEVKVILPTILAGSGEEKFDAPQNPGQALSLDADFDDFDVEDADY